jgi:hypothetical protein
VVSSTPRPHFTPGKDPVPIIQEAGWAPGPVLTGGKSRPHGIRCPDRPARSQSLYRPSYPAHEVYILYVNIRRPDYVRYAPKYQFPDQLMKSEKSLATYLDIFCDVLVALLKLLQSVVFNWSFDLVGLVGLVLNRK